MDHNALEAMLRAWGTAKRRINGIPPQPKSIFGRIATEGSVGAAIRGQPPESPEVMLGPALEVSVAIRRAIEGGKLRDKPFEAVFLQYVCHGPVKAKAHQLGVSRTIYYERLNVGKGAIKAHLEL